MRIAGNATLHAPVEAVYAALQDPAVLVRTIPGCERLEQVGEDAYQMTVTAGVASVRGTYAGDVRLTDQHAPHGFILQGERLRHPRHRLRRRHASPSPRATTAPPCSPTTPTPPSAA